MSRLLFKPPKHWLGLAVSDFCWWPSNLWRYSEPSDSCSYSHFGFSNKMPVIKQPGGGTFQRSFPLNPGIFPHRFAL